jgi:hypothetical protein
MPHLRMSDGAKFSGLIEKHEGSYRASYRVVRDGPKPEVDIDMRMFSSRESATKWLDVMAVARGFTAYELSGVEGAGALAGLAGAPGRLPTAKARG